MKLNVLVPEDALLDHLAPLPDGVRLSALPRRPADAHVLVASAEVCEQIPDILPDLPSLRLIQSLHAGVDLIVPHLPSGVTLCTARGVHDGPVADWVLTMILTLYRRVPELLEAQREGVWRNSISADADDLVGKRVLIVGHGAIGRAVEARLLPFGASVTGIARRTRPGVATLADLGVLLPQVDVVVLLAPLTEQTQGLVDAEFLSSMKDGSLLVNAGRGQLVEQRALLDALKDGKIRAALDAHDPEPLPEDHPLWRVPNVILTPHLAGNVRPWRARAYGFVGDQLRRYAVGESLLNVYDE